MNKKKWQLDWLNLLVWSGLFLFGVGEIVFLVFIIRQFWRLWHP